MSAAKKMRRRSLLVPVLLVLAVGAVLCRLNLPAGDPEVDVFADGEGGSIFEQAGNEILSEMGDWSMRDYGLFKIATWEPGELLGVGGGLERVRLVALPFAGDWIQVDG